MTDTSDTGAEAPQETQTETVSADQVVEESAQAETVVPTPDDPTPTTDPNEGASAPVETSAPTTPAETPGEQTESD